MNNVWYVEDFAPLMGYKHHSTMTIDCGNLPVTTLVPSQSLIDSKTQRAAHKRRWLTTTVLMEEPASTHATHNTSVPSEQMDTFCTTMGHTSINIKKQAN